MRTVRLAMIVRMILFVRVGNARSLEEYVSPFAYSADRSGEIISLLDRKD